MCYEKFISTVIHFSLISRTLWRYVKIYNVCHTVLMARNMRTIDNQICIEAIKMCKTSADNAQETMMCLFPRIIADALLIAFYLAPHRGRARYCNAHVCLFVCLFVRVFAKFQSVIFQPFLNRSL